MFSRRVTTFVAVPKSRDLPVPPTSYHICPSPKRVVTCAAGWQEPVPLDQKSRDIPLDQKSRDVPLDQKSRDMPLDQRVVTCRWIKRVVTCRWIKRVVTCR